MTETGRRSLLTNLADTPEANLEVWDDLPGFQWYAPVVRAKGGTDVLAVHKDAANEFGVFGLGDASAGDAHPLCDFSARHSERVANRTQPTLRRDFEAGNSSGSAIDDAAVLLPDDRFDAYLSIHRLAP